MLNAVDKANHAGSLADYRTSLRQDVLPAMDAFIARLKTVPTGTPELGSIHGRLVAAYVTARGEIDAFEKELEGIDGLPKFAAIRDRLQAAVKTYRAELQAYYSRFHRQLQVEPAAVRPPAQVTPAAPQTPTGASE